MTSDASSRPDAPRRYIGVSLGGGRGKTTAIARLEWRADGSPLVLVEARVKEGHRGAGADTHVTETPGALGYFRDDALLRYLTQWPEGESVLAIDVPLSFPPCVGCQRRCPGIEACSVPDVQWMRNHVEQLRPRKGRSDRYKPLLSPYTERATDLLCEALGEAQRETLGTTMGPLAGRAAFLQRALAPQYRIGENLVEVSPRLAIARSIDHRKEEQTRRGSLEEVWSARRDVLRRMIAGLEVQGVWPELVARNIHVFRALVSAWLAWRWYAEGRPRVPAILPRNDRERNVFEALNPSLNWTYWDEHPLPAIREIPVESEPEKRTDSQKPSRSSVRNLVLLSGARATAGEDCALDASRIKPPRSHE